MKILTAAEMQACDRATTERFGIPSLQLMRSASSAAAGLVALQFPEARRITVLCGRGNNGGDGLMTARLLMEAGHSVHVLLLGDPGGIKGDAAEAWRELIASPNLPVGSIRIVTQAEELVRHGEILDADLLIDAIVGTGFRPPLRDLPLAALEWVQNSPESQFEASANSGYRYPIWVGRGL